MILRLLTLASLLLLSACDSRLSGDYQSEVILNVNSRLFPITCWSHQPKNYIDAEIDTITSHPILEAASKPCHVEGNVIKKSLPIEQIEDTDLIRITAFSNYGREAERIVTAVADSFISHRAEIGRAQADMALEALDSELESHGQVVAEKKRALTALVELQKEFASDKEICVSVSMQQHEYNSAKDYYEQARDLLRAIKIQQQELRVLRKMPRNPITIHRAAITKKRS
ncbi:hypothetical protein N9055_00620 [Akkermansiaceae bacterium]|nr:hypothetical protein [Akkermansiaceae bacterium]